LRITEQSGSIWQSPEISKQEVQYLRQDNKAMGSRCSHVLPVAGETLTVGELLPVIAGIYVTGTVAGSQLMIADGGKPWVVISRPRH
jgi:hypothetical protein